MISRRKKILSIFITTMVLSQSFISTTKVFADTHKLNNFTPHNRISNLSTNNVSLENILKKDLRDLAFNFSYRRDVANLISKSHKPLSKDDNWASLDPWNFKYSGPFARVNNDMTLKNGKTLAAHSATLSNSSGIDQIMKTASFTYTSTNEVITTTTHSVGGSITGNVSSSLKIPFIGQSDVSISLTANYNFNRSNSVKTVETHEWSVPSQDIKVPSGHKYKVTWILQTGIATGTTDLVSNVKAIVPCEMDSIGRYGFGLYYTLKSYDNLNYLDRFIWTARDNWNIDDNYNVFCKLGTARYEATFGTNFLMTITDVTNPRHTFKVKSIPIKLTSKTLK